MNSRLNMPARVTVFAVLTLLVIAAALTLPKLTSGPVFAQLTPPAAPTGLTAAAVGTQTVELTWTAPAGVTVTGYAIQRSTETPVKWVDVTANTGNKNLYYSDTHSSLAGKSVVYRVAAINSIGTGIYTAASTPAVTLPVAGTQPGAPTGLKATESPTTAGSISLSWSAPSQGENAIDAYNVQWSATGEHTWEDIGTQPSGTGTTATDTVPAGTTRYYRVAAENTTTPNDGRGPYSDSVSVMTRPAGVPAAPTAAPTVYVVGTQTVELTWTTSADATVTGYKIERSTDGGTTWAVVSANTGNKNLYYSDTHSSLAGKSVVYRVAAINSVGVGDNTASSASAVLPKAGAQPGAPTGLRVTGTGPTTVRLDWTAPSSPGETPIDGYVVQSSANGEHTWANIGIQPSGTDPTTTDTVAQGTTKYYRVAATNTTPPLRGPYSAVRRSPTAGVPVAPTAAPGTYVVGTQTVELTWTAPEGVSVTGYKIQRSTDAGTTWVDVVANTGNDNEYYSDTHSSLAGKSVVYQVAAINSVGVGVYSAASTAVTLPVAGTQPGMPRGFKATESLITAGTISLSWDAPSSQGASPIAGYVVQWSANGEHTWADIGTQPSATNTTATDTAVPAGATRHYRVAANNSATPPRGPYSDSVSVTTRPAGVPTAPATLTAYVVGTQTVELTWVLATDAGTITGTGYRIERSTDGGTTWVVVSDNTENKNLYYSDTHSSLAGKSVSYRVAGINSFGMGSYAELAAAATLPKAGTQPGAPTGLTLTQTGFTTVRLDWTAPSSSGSTAIDGYVVQSSANGEHTWTNITAQPSGTATTTTDTVDQGATKYYRVAATNTTPPP